MTPTLRGWRPGGNGLLCHQLGHKPTSQQVLILGYEPITLTEGNVATGLLLLETWDLPLVVPYGAFLHHGNAIKKFNSLENKK